MSSLLTKLALLLLNILTFCCSITWASSCAGCLDLDDVNFDKTLKRFPYALVKFDIAFPYGEKHEAFAAFSQIAHSATDDLLIATVGIKDYGENENKALGKRFNVDDKNFPAIFLFRNGEQKPIPLPSHLEVTLDNLKAFVSSNTDLYIGREGCLKQFNDLAKNFANLEDDEQMARVQESEKLSDNLTKEEERTSAKIYLTFMAKIKQHGYKFVEEETKRLLRLIAGKVSQAKKNELKIKFNVLESFRVHKLTKEEL